MTLAYYTNVISPHQIPLAKEIVRRVGAENYRYIYRYELSDERRMLGWDERNLPSWCRHGEDDSPELMDVDLLCTGGLRPLDVIARRIAVGKPTYYVTERWFKPLRRCGIPIPGKCRMLVPRYRRMAKRMVEYMNNPLCRCLAIGPWAKRDMVSIGVRPDHIYRWGYYVEPSADSPTLQLSHSHSNSPTSPLKLLWVGRMLALKRVDTIVKAVGHLGGEGVKLTLVGGGEERRKLERMARGLPVEFVDSKPIAEIRDVMREHDVYVLASDANEGWGAVVNEALEERMKVLGTFEAGASAALLDEEDLFHSGDWRRLAGLIARCAREKREGRLHGQGIGDETPKAAAKRLLEELCWRC